MWKDFSATGTLEGAEGDIPYSRVGAAIGAAVAAKVLIPPGQRRQLVFCLAWDMPLARMGLGAAYYRRYTKFYGREGNNVQLMIRDALAHYPSWDAAIERWQAPVLNDPDLPIWYKTALFNELYYLVDGGTIWTAGAETEEERQARRIVVEPYRPPRNRPVLGLEQYVVESCWREREGRRRGSSSWLTHVPLTGRCNLRANSLPTSSVSRTLSIYATAV